MICGKEEFYAALVSTLRLGFEELVAGLYLESSLGESSPPY